MTLVILTTVFFGSTMGLLNRCLFGPHGHGHARAYKEHDPFASEYSSASYALSCNSEYEPLIHPNEDMDYVDPGASLKHMQEVDEEEDNSFLHHFSRLDEFVLKPMFVHKYDKKMIEFMKEFYEVMAHDGYNIE